MGDRWVSLWWQAMCLPDRWDICGIKVLSASVWHTLALENIDNAYLCGGVPTRDDAFSLLMVTSLPYPKGRDLLLRDGFRRERSRRAFKRVAIADFDELDARCRDYAASCLRIADRVERDGRPTACPYQFHIVRRLCAEFGYSVIEAWNEKFALARCYFDAGAESSGDDSLISQRAQEALDQGVIG